MTALARLARMPPVTGERAVISRPARPLPRWAPLASLLLHAAALAAVLLLLERSQAPEAPPEHGVEYRPGIPLPAPDAPDAPDTPDPTAPEGE